MHIAHSQIEFIRLNYKQMVWIRNLTKFKCLLQGTRLQCLLRSLCFQQNSSNFNLSLLLFSISPKKVFPYFHWKFLRLYHVIYIYFFINTRKQESKNTRIQEYKDKRIQEYLFKWRSICGRKDKNTPLCSSIVNSCYTIKFLLS